MKRSLGLIFGMMLTAFLCGAQELPDEDVHKTDGRASYYAKNFQGRKTANGEMFNNTDFTAAHRTLPFNTYLNVVNKENNYNIIVRVNDRGPYAANRIIDLSEAAARRIGGYHHGLVPVKVEVINYIQLTPELDSLFRAHRVTDCFGNRAILENYNLSLWSSSDLLHVIYIANDLYLKEDVSSVLIVRKKMTGKDYFHVVLTGYKTKTAMLKAKDLYERKGFMKVLPFSL